MYDLLKDRIPLFIQSLGISLALIILKRLSLKQAVFTFFLVFNSLWLIEKYAPTLRTSILQGAGFGMIGGGDLDPDCVGTCQNPAATTNLAQTVQHATSSAVQIAENIAGKIGPTATAVVDKASHLFGQTVNTNNEFVKPVIPQEPAGPKINQIIDTVGLCNALREAGFQDDWTTAKVAEMKGTVDGLATLTKINDAVLTRTGLTDLTHEQISKCFPGYVQTYQCKKLSPQREGCNMSLLKQDLRLSIDTFYKDKSYTEQQKNKTYMIQRSELEMKNLMNIFRSKTHAEWLTYLTDLKRQSSVGFKVEGTDYVIPWDLFDKYTICWGN